MPNQDDSKLYVFDRYGKLLKQLYPNGPWDGTYNGQPMPADDYFIYHTKRVF
jgi:gliding motility-associated-like protein